MSERATGHVLIVEDDAGAREALAQILLAAGYDVATADDGAQALAYLRAAPRPCVIVLDLMMPVLDGWQFRAEQRQDPAVAAIPVVVATAAERAEQNAAALGVDDYLTKPIDVERLLTVIGRYCTPRREGNGGDGERRGIRSGAE